MSFNNMADHALPLFAAGVRLGQEDNGADGEDNECNGERTDAG